MKLGKRPYILYLITCVTVLALGISHVSAQESAQRWTTETTLRYKSVGDTAISPDGKLIAYTVREALTEGELSEFRTHIWIVAADGSMNYQFTYGDRSCFNPSFSPDGKYLAFLSSRGSDKKTQIWLSRFSGGDPEQLTKTTTGVNAYSWSPDGLRIAYTMTDPPSEEEQKRKREKRDARVLDTNFIYSHLYTIAVEKDSQDERKVKRLTQGDFHVSSNSFMGSNPPFDWSPDGKTIVFEHQVSPLSEDWTTGDISCVPSDGGPVRPLMMRNGVDSKPRYSPDGKWIVFASDNGNTKHAFLQDFYIMPSEGGEAKKLAKTYDRYSSQIMGWSTDGKEFYYLELYKTSQELFSIPIDGGKPRMITKGSGEYSGIVYSKDSKKMAYVYQTTELAPNIYISDTEDLNPVKLTDVNAHYPKYPMGKTQVITWKSQDGLEVEGLLTYPVNYEEGRRYPLILNIHGGPTGVFIQSYTAASSIYPVQVYAEEGFAILRPNPRGSAGYGCEFRFANYNDWGFGDYEDVMSGVDKVIEMGVADPDSLCVMGWSYGGYLTSFVVTKTHRFKAASVGAGFPNLMSFTGTTDVPGFIPDYLGGQPWDRMEAYMKHSGMFHVKGVTTPTQILHGEEDTRIPIGQGLEFYSALKIQGCPTEMVVYPRTPHSPREPKFVIDIADRVLKWFNKHLGRESKR